MKQTVCDFGIRVVISPDGPKAVKLGGNWYATLEPVGAAAQATKFSIGYQSGENIYNNFSVAVIPLDISLLSIELGEHLNINFFEKFLPKPTGV